jgi:DNA replicative helicase MCM subunit Mcm2 (Cdc46/Mcm family)
VVSVVDLIAAYLEFVMRELFSHRYLLYSPVFRAATDGQKKDCPMDPYMIIHPKCSFVDHQTLKLQEAPDMVPVGELPKHMLLSADRYVLFLRCGHAGPIILR